MCTVVVTLAIFVALHGALGGYNWPPVRSDGEGYFAYLPAFVLHRTFDLGILAPHFGGTIPPWSGLFTDPVTGRTMDMYPIGVALLLAPFFIAAHVAVLVTDIGPADGYSILYQLTPLFAAATYYVIGMCALVTYLESLVPSGALLRTAVLITFGTSLFHYATYDAVFSHVYSFCFVSLLLLLSRRFWNRSDAGTALATGAVLGILFLIRNYNVLYWLIFGLYPVALRGSVARTYFERRAGLLVVGGVALAAAASHFVVSRLTAGRFVANPYAQVGTHFGIHFDFTSPHVREVLFSLEKGVFAWAPLLALALAGLVVAVVQRENRELRVMAGGALAVLAGLTYLIASWQGWNFGGGFGHRGFVDAYPLFAIGLTILLATPRRGIALAVNSLAAIATLVTATLMDSYWIGKVPFGHSTTDLDIAAVEYVAALRSAPGRWIARLRRPTRDSRALELLGATLRDVTLVPASTEVQRGERIEVSLVAENTGQAYWLDAAPGGVGRVGLAILWFRSHDVAACSEPFGEAQSRETILLPSAVEPGDSVRLAGVVHAPAIAGRYVMLIDLVSENVTWFRERGSIPRCYEFEVK